jgi:tetratricopeptide (TPR) repeat protein
MIPAMKAWLAAAVAGIIGWLPAAEISSVEDAIPSPVKIVAKPGITPVQGGIRMAVTAATDEAQSHVNLGLNHLHGGWEFEASRHFAEAMRQDPDCLLAHWGMVMSLLSPSAETIAARNAATDRMLHLLDEGHGTALERGYAYGLVKYIEEGPAGAAAAFLAVARDFPNDIQAPIFAALFGRTGYDELGSATPAQETAEKSLLALIEKHPNTALPLHALLSVRAEAPDVRDSLELARKLCQMAPDYPPYFHVLGHYEWRSGNHARAASAFGQATLLLDRWMKENETSYVDSPEWVKAECYRIVALVSKGEFDNAYAAARQIAAKEIPADRAGSAGARILLWEARSLPARILMHRGLRGNVIEAAASLPTPESMAPYRSQSLAYWWLDGLRFALDAQRQLEAGRLEEAIHSANALAAHGEEMAKTQPQATANGERSNWNRSFRALEVIASELRGRIALAGPADGRGSAYNWFRSATDRQRPASMMAPPLVLTPMAVRLGEYFLASNRIDDALDAYQEALEAFPNDLIAIQGLIATHEAAKNEPEAEKYRKVLEDLRAR